MGYPHLVPTTKPGVYRVSPTLEAWDTNTARAQVWIAAENRYGGTCGPIELRKSHITGYLYARVELFNPPKITA